MSDPPPAARRSAARRAAREATRAAGGDGDAAPRTAPARGGGSADPLTGPLRRAGLVRLLVLQLLADEAPTYGNHLIERIREQSAGLVTVNPNTMYPLLRALEEEGLAVGEWEHPVRRSRRFYRLTAAGDVERERLRGEVAPVLDAVADGVEALRRRLAA
ncbi:MAG: PadR family transcriptional regulator [Solirubrobacteraceae bacterium]|nr:PadR family transcriptional regulator [Solirubrobacteraceae bacterium]